MKASSNNNEIKFEFDEITEHYYIIWQLRVISSGKTKEEALEDLREAAHHGVDTIIDLELKDVGEVVTCKRGEDGKREANPLLNLYF